MLLLKKGRLKISDGLPFVAKRLQGATFWLTNYKEYDSKLGI